MSSKENEKESKSKNTSSLSIADGATISGVLHAHNITKVDEQHVDNQHNENITQNIDIQNVREQHNYFYATSFQNSPTIDEHQIENLIMQVKNHYKNKKYLESGLDNVKPFLIKEGYIRLAIVHEKEQSEKEKVVLEKREDSEKKRIFSKY